MTSIAIGNSVGKYRITDLIGKGGMGAVYKAHDPDLERDVALKVMDPSLAHDETFMKRFRVEAKALAQLNNTHIVKVHALQESDFGACIIMEFVYGKTLAEIIKHGGALDRKRLFHLFRQILTAFEYAHKAGVIHRDIKPSNIMVTEADEVKVTDFGLAKLHRATTATVTQLTGGTLYYVSPEQIEGLFNVDHRGDIYSIGMTMFEALTGAIPFEHTESDFRIRERIVNGKIRPPQSFDPKIPKRLNDFVVKAIACRPDDRFQTMSEMISAFEKLVVAEREEETRILTVSTGKERQLSFSNVWVWIASAAVLIILGLVVKNIFGSKADDIVAETPTVELKQDEEKTREQEKVEKSSDEQAERERLEGERIERERVEKEKLLANETEKEKPEKAERDRLAAKNIEREKGQKEKAEKGKPIASREEIAKNEKPEIPKPIEEKKETERPKPAESSGAETMNHQLARLRDEVVGSLERKDIGALQSLLNLSASEVNIWESFFDKAKDIAITVNQFKVIPAGQNSAEVEFRATMTSYNTTTDESVTQPMIQRWQCELQGATWRIVSNKR
jgi:serine/threonine protein kinase